MSISRKVSVGRDMPTSWVMVSMEPFTVNSPPSASITPDRMRRMVLLPTPLAPTRAACSPGAIPKLTSKNS